MQPTVIYIDENEKIESLSFKFAKYPYWHITDSTGAILYQKFDPSITANKRSEPLDFAASLEDAIEYAKKSQEPRLVLHYGNNKADIGNKPKTFIITNQDEAAQAQQDPILFLAKLQNNPIAAALEGLAGVGAGNANAGTGMNQLALLSKIAGGKNAAATEFFERFLEFQEEAHAREMETQRQMFDMQLKASQEANKHQIELLRLEMQQAADGKKGGLNGVMDSVAANPEAILNGIANLASAVLPFFKTPVAAATSVAGATGATTAAQATASTTTATAATNSATAQATERKPRSFQINTDDDEEEEDEEDGSDDEENDEDEDDGNVYEIDASSFSDEQRRSLDNVMGEMEFNPDLAKEIEDFIRFKKTKEAEKTQQ
ncbi:hypothetical protein SAMN05421780_1249 [Flexibacter flexilis DSM 6793]|uniref:Uncharacterized protein n=1 Tax=Flexibacter flexilis DSM 6793 TaxID=927664 RepID=A0A1I1NYX6_9BACT|nr:hypothetical protein [Flexibacter flexilis]SFD02606.1 hypothetical protein SAMN05421780_1249 [Flexibacter flexilis DSM 6793]